MFIVEVSALLQLGKSGLAFFRWRRRYEVLDANTAPTPGLQL
jgi:hypothetical protein